MSILCSSICSNIYFAAVFAVVFVAVYILCPYCAEVFTEIYILQHQYIHQLHLLMSAIASYSLKRMKISCKKYYLHHCHHHRCPYPRKITKKKQTQNKEGGNHKLVRLYDHHFQFVIIKPFWGRLPFVAEKIKRKNSSTFLGRRRMSHCEN